MLSHLFDRLEHNTVSTFAQLLGQLESPKNVGIYVVTHVVVN